MQHTKIFQYATCFCACLPWLVVIAWGGLAAHVRLGLGHWPAPLWDQYTTVLFQWHGVLVIVLWAALLLTFPLALFLLLRRTTWEAASRRTMALVYLMGAWFLVALGLCLAKTSFWAWWSD
jgi:hypothetical protein